jgi:hypothetical protein
MAKRFAASWVFPACPSLATARSARDRQDRPDPVRRRMLLAPSRQKPV